MIMHYGVFVVEQNIYMYNNNDELISLFLSGLHPCDAIICRVRFVNRHFEADESNACAQRIAVSWVSNGIWSQMRNSNIQQTTDSFKFVYLYISMILLFEVW